jgi:hypothetical protein
MAKQFFVGLNAHIRYDFFLQVVDCRLQKDQKINRNCYEDLYFKKWNIKHKSHRVLLHRDDLLHSTSWLASLSPGRNAWDDEWGESNWMASASASRLAVEEQPTYSGRGGPPFDHEKQRQDNWGTPGNYCNTTSTEIMSKIGLDPGRVDNTISMMATHRRQGDEIQRI